MIRVTKPPGPDALLAGVDRMKENCDEHDADVAAYSSGVRQFDFAQAIYGHEAVRTALREAQHRKCCYCENRNVAFAPLHVEHYRPKGAVRQDRESRKLLPGYYWLAYSWDNLHLCCPECNGNKSYMFPLVDDTVRARSHRDDITRESPLLLDPGGADDPRAHIRFKRDRAVGLTETGRRTIEVLKLNRPALIEERQKCLGRLRELQDVVQRLDADGLGPGVIELRERARRKLARAPLPSAIFSAMAADYLCGHDAVGTEAEAP